MRHGADDCAAGFLLPRVALQEISRLNASADLGIIGGVPTIRGTILRVPIVRIILFQGLYWGPLILGNYHLGIITPLGPRWANGKENGKSLEYRKCEKPSMRSLVLWHNEVSS